MPEKLQIHKVKKGSLSFKNKYRTKEHSWKRQPRKFIKPYKMKNHTGMLARIRIVNLTKYNIFFKFYHKITIRSDQDGTEGSNF